MVLAFPFFLAGGWLASRKQPVRLTGRDWVRLALLGFCGWYLSSVINFMGLEHVSVGLERMILYTYPSLVVLGSVAFMGKPLRWKVVVAMLVAVIMEMVGALDIKPPRHHENMLVGAEHLNFCAKKL